jgi:hypothetical protein
MERQGFRYSKSRIKFARTCGAAVQEVSFSLGRYNSEDDCNFWTMWGARSPDYAKWYRKEWGERPANDFLGGCADWNIPGWDRASTHNFNLTHVPADLAEIERLMRNVSHAGLPYIERLSSFLGAAEELTSRDLDYATAADFFLMAGERGRAREALTLGLQRFEVGGRIDQGGQIPEIKKRLQRYF